MIQLVVEHLHHDIGAGKVRKPIAEDVVRKEPPPDPATLKVEPQRFSEGWLGEGARFVAQPIVDSRKRSTRHTGNHIDLFEQLTLLQFKHDGGAEVRRAASSSGDGKREKAIVLPFEFGQVPRAGGLGHRLLAGPLFVPTRAPVAGQNGTARRSPGGDRGCRLSSAISSQNFF